jgi:hypothetical protein
MPADDLAGVLARMRGHLEHNDVQQVMGRDMPALLAGYEALIALGAEMATDTIPECAEADALLWAKQEAGARILDTITEALTGEAPGTMRALSVQQPWASAIVYGGKTRENRSWATGYRGPVWIHASQTVDWAAPRHAWNAAGLLAPPQDGRRFDKSTWTSSLYLGCIHGRVNLTGIHPTAWECKTDDACREWGIPGQFHWRLADPRPLADPVPCKGALQLWRVPEAVEKTIRTQLETTRA